MSGTKSTIKPTELTKNESLYTFNAWKQRLLYFLRSDTVFAVYVPLTWKKYNATSAPTRGLEDAAGGTPSAETKNAQLENMLELVASYTPIISRNSIVKHSTSLDNIFILTFGKA